MPVTLVCHECGDTYQKPPSRAKESHYCSKKCRSLMLQRLAKERIGSKHQHYTERQKVACNACGKEFEKKTAILKKQKLGVNYCSKGCKNKHLSWLIFKPGKDHPVWRGGSLAYRGLNWKIQRIQALDRDEWTCQRCYGYTTDVHHIRPFVFFLNYLDANELTNLRSLCKSCHRKEESEFWKGYDGELPISPYRYNHIACKVCGETFVGATKNGGVHQRCLKCRQRKCKWCNGMFFTTHTNDKKVCCSKSCGMKFSWSIRHGRPLGLS